MRIHHVVERLYFKQYCWHNISLCYTVLYNLLTVTVFQGLFTMDQFYRHWKNTEGQLSLFQQILRNPDIFCFAGASTSVIRI
jgi:hypothetical protein